MRRLIVLALCVAAATAPGCKKEEGPAARTAETLRVDVEAARTEPLADRVLTTGLLEAGQWASLYFGAGGTVTRVPATENQKVGAGSLLAELDTEAQRNNVSKAQVNLDMARLNEAQAAHKLQQTRALLEAGGASPEDVYDREQRLLEAQNQVKTAQLNLESAKIHLGDMELRAPFSGVLTEVNIRVGDLVHGDVSDPDRDMNRRPPMVMTRDSSGLIVRGQLPEGRAVRLIEGIPVEVTLMEHRDVVLKGKVSWVSKTVDRDTRTVHFKVSLDKIEGTLPPAARDGASVLVALLTEVHQDAVTLSERAIYYSQNKAFAFVVGPDNKIKQVEVQKGVTAGGRVEIKNGIAAGDKVARSHLYLLRDGAPVEIRSELAEARP